MRCKILLFYVLSSSSISECCQSSPLLCKVLSDEGFRALLIDNYQGNFCVVEITPRCLGFAREIHGSRGRPQKSSQSGSNVLMCFFFFFSHFSLALPHLLCLGNGEPVQSDRLKYADGECEEMAAS